MSFPRKRGTCDYCAESESVKVTLHLCTGHYGLVSKVLEQRVVKRV
jgi:hypothetical protein